MDNLLPSDHGWLSFNMDITRPDVPKVKRMIRNTSSIQEEQLIQCVCDLPPITSSTDDVSSADRLAELFHGKMSTVLDKLAPVKEKVIRAKVRAPWYSDELREMKTSLRRLDRKWLHHPLEVNKQIFHAARRSYHSTIDQARTDYRLWKD